MNKVQALLEDLAPEGVPFIALGEVANIQTGQAFDKAKLGGPYAVWNGGVTTNQNLAEWNTLGDTITIPARGSVGIVGYQDKDFWCGPLCYRIRFRDADFSNRYLYFFLKSIEPAIKSLQQSGSIPALNKKELESVRIPIPPALVQIEIVKILDKFTELKGSLEAELGWRRIQYGYYRNQLLTFAEREVPFSDLSDLYDFQYGMGNTIPTSGGEYPVYGSNGIVGSHSEFNSEDAPIIGHIGAYAGIINWASGKHFVTYNGVICKIKNGHNPRFGYHLLNNLNLRELANAGSQPFVSYDKLEKVQVQLPTIDVQVQIAKHLDSFELLTKDSKFGLPAEIEARQQQFEHYLDRILTFRELTPA